MLDMAVSLRKPWPNEKDALTALCLRSKAYWGYDADFMRMCTQELQITDQSLNGKIIVAELNGSVAGLAEVNIKGDEGEIDKLFVDTSCMGNGVGRHLLDWCLAIARAADVKGLRIEADPGAVPFYQRMGAVQTGEAPSGSLPGRMLPVMHLNLR